MKEIKIFEWLGVRAGFTQRPEKSTDIRSMLANEARDRNKVVLWPYLVHGTRIAVCRASAPDAPPLKVDRAPDFISLKDIKAVGKPSDAPFDEKLRLSLSFGGSAFATNVAENSTWTDARPDTEPSLEWRSEALLGIGATDGCVTDVPGVVLTSTHGDCLPIYIYDPVKKAVGLAHAGWRGTYDGIAAVLADTMVREFGSDPMDMLAYIGPGIDFCCFEVNEDVAEAFTDRYYWAQEMTAIKPLRYEKQPHAAGPLNAGDAEETEYQPVQKYLVDLKAVNDELLKISGIPEENINICRDCTVCDAESYYSHRRAKEKDRMLAYICLDM
ncbi:MAG: polyphenol oxidase family protein [Firmicutes bacterium]|nr:polyphenol oxidase family protein [Bacillota bacterium]